MPITIGSNISSLRAQRQLASGTGKLETVFERLSSGQRINKASDDAAGLAISEALSSDRRVFTQGVRNLNDGLSALAIADSAIENLSLVVTRLKELTIQAANGSLGAEQRKSLDAEAQALKDEFFRIQQTTEFNGIKLFTGENSSLRLQAGFGLDGGIDASVGGAIGTGLFGPTPSHYQLASGVMRDVTAGDLNYDGIADMVVVGTDASNGVAYVSLGLGDGTFQPRTTYVQESSFSNSVVLGDIDNDGILDLVTSGTTDASTGVVTVRTGNGDGTFSASTTYLVDPTDDAYSVALGDLDGDGNLDLAATATSGGGFTSIRFGDGSGAFSNAVSYAFSGTEARNIDLHDLDGDGVLDLITSGNNSRIEVRIGNGQGEFGDGTTYISPQLRPWELAFGDLNGDGHVDLLAAMNPSVTSRTSTATFLLGNGDGTFGSFNTIDTGENTGRGIAVGIADLNGDGKQDMVVNGQWSDGTNGYLSVLLGEGEGTFAEAVTYLTTDIQDNGLALADFNNDGVLDVVTVGHDGETIAMLATTRDGISPLLEFSLSSVSHARQALPIFTNKLDQLAQQRGEIGAFQSRIAVATNVLSVSAENFAAAAGRIKDADVVQETSQLTRLNILQQAASAVLAQANQQPALALRLLS